MSTELRAGDIMITGMDGFIPGVFPVAVGQGALFLTRAWWTMVRTPRTWWHWRHAAVVIGGDLVTGEAMICQAMPKGVEEVGIGHRFEDPGTLFIRPEYDGRQFLRVAAAARNYLGTPYGFTTYLKLAAGAFRFRATEALLRRWISTRKDMICSQHVDQSLADAGFHVFSDGRLPQDVVPAELADALLNLPGWFRIPNHPVFHHWTDNKLRIRT
jgi:hypothetical protein